MNENEWTRKICKELEQHNAIVFALVGSEMQTVGIPDRYICHSRWQGWLEFKGVNTVLSTIQRKRINDLNARQPGLAYVIRYPGNIESSNGIQLAVFHNVAELLDALVELTDYYKGKT